MVTSKNIVPSKTLLWEDSWTVKTGCLYGNELKYYTQPHIGVSRLAELSWLDGSMVTSKNIVPSHTLLWADSWAVMSGWLYGDLLKYCTLATHCCEWVDELNCHDWMAVWWLAKILYPATHCCEQMSWAVMTGWLYGDQLKYCTQQHIAVSRCTEQSWLDGCMMTS